MFVFFPVCFFSWKEIKKYNQKIIFQARFDRKSHERLHGFGAVRPRQKNSQASTCVVFSADGSEDISRWLLSLLMLCLSSLQMLLNIYLRFIYFLKAKQHGQLKGERKICILLKPYKTPVNRSSCVNRPERDVCEKTLKSARSFFVVVLW